MTPSTRSIAEDLADYLRETDGVCAEGNVHGWRWIRFHDGEWQAASYATGGGDHLNSYVEAEILDEAEALDWLEAKPATIIPQPEAYLWRPSTEAIWEDAERQDVFGDAERCFWCGESEHERDLDSYETHEHGEIPLCDDCRGAWERSGELVEDTEATA